MIGWLRFLRVRGIPAAACGLLVLDVLTLLVGDRRIVAAYGSGAGIPYATFLPLLAACVVGATARSRMWQFEATGGRAVPPARLFVLLAVMGFAAAGLVLATLRITGPVATVAALRNLVGLSGLAALGAAVAGGRLSWVAPSALVLLVVSVSGAVQGVPAWAWLVRPDADATAWSIAVALFIVGAACVTLAGTREPVDERE